MNHQFMNDSTLDSDCFALIAENATKDDDERHSGLTAFDFIFVLHFGLSKVET
jgi:hypothetical protein